MRFRDRADAGRRLGALLAGRALTDPVVLALPRGGVPVGHHVAEALAAPLDVLVSRKIGAPGHPEFGIGAVAEGGGVVADPEAVRRLGIDPATWEGMVEAARREVRERASVLGGGRPPPETSGRDVVLVDDGLATGVTAEAAVRALRPGRPRGVVLAVPVAAHATARRMEGVADLVVCLRRPRRLVAVGRWYEDFRPTGDEEVLALLARHRGGPSP